MQNAYNFFLQIDRIMYILQKTAIKRKMYLSNSPALVH